MNDSFFSQRFHCLALTTTRYLPAFCRLRLCRCTCITHPNPNSKEKNEDEAENLCKRQSAGCTNLVGNGIYSLPCSFCIEDKLRDEFDEFFKWIASELSFGMKRHPFPMSNSDEHRSCLKRPGLDDSSTLFATFLIYSEFCTETTAYS